MISLDLSGIKRAQSIMANGYVSNCTQSTYVQLYEHYTEPMHVSKHICTLTKGAKLLDNPTTTLQRDGVQGKPHYSRCTITPVGRWLQCPITISQARLHRSLSLSIVLVLFLERPVGYSSQGISVPRFLYVASYSFWLEPHMTGTRNLY